MVGGRGGGGGLIFGPRIFLVSSGIQEFCNGKTALEKNGDCSCNGIPITCVMSSEREFCSGLSQFHCRNEVKQGHKVQKINCRPDYILERIDIWCTF